jgi:hypothetical protein
MACAENTVRDLAVCMARTDSPALAEIERERLDGKNAASAIRHRIHCPVTIPGSFKEVRKLDLDQCSRLKTALI